MVQKPPAVRRLHQTLEFWTVGPLDPAEPEQNSGPSGRGSAEPHQFSSSWSSMVPGTSRQDGPKVRDPPSPGSGSALYFREPFVAGPNEGSGRLAAARRGKQGSSAHSGSPRSDLEHRTRFWSNELHIKGSVSTHGSTRQRRGFTAPTEPAPGSEQPAREPDAAGMFPNPPIIRGVGEDREEARHDLGTDPIRAVLLSRTAASPPP